MDSINKNQEEENHKDLNGIEGVKKIKELAENKTCFFATGISSGNSLNVRPMSAQKVDENGSLYFLSANDSHKNKDLATDPNVQLLFQGSPHSDFLSLYGLASVSTDKALIKELWEPILKVWFTEGEDDPRITVIIVTPTEGYYWDNKHGNAIAMVKMAAGAIMGKTIDDSIEGTIKP